MKEMVEWRRVLARVCVCVCARACAQARVLDTEDDHGFPLGWQVLWSKAVKLMGGVMSNSHCGKKSLRVWAWSFLCALGLAGM